MYRIRTCGSTYGDGAREDRDRKEKKQMEMLLHIWNQSNTRNLYALWGAISVSVLLIFL